MKRVTLFLVAIFILSFALRFYQLGEIPVGFHRDEAFLGYNAYSILKTGKDMSGNFFPLHLESFIYSPAGYSYFSIPFIKLFDLNTFSVRFASAFFGSLTILLTYFLVNRLFPPNKQPPLIALLSSGLLAISPWHINLSRTATENVLVVFFIALGVLLLLIWIEKSKWQFLVLSFLSFAITLFFYQASRAFLPLFVPFMLFLLLKSKVTREKLLSVGALFLLTIILPLSMVLLSNDLSLRLRTVSIFATEESQLVIDEKLREDGISDTPILLTRLLHNKPIVYSSHVLENYFKHFSYNFLFTDGGFPDRYRIPLMGILYIFELPLLFAGAWILLQKSGKSGLFLLGWVVLAPVGTALTFDDVPNMQRTLIIFPALSIIEAFGLSYLLSLDKMKKVKKYVETLGILIVSCSLLFYLHQYYIHGPLYRPWYRQDGYKELVEKVNRRMPTYTKAMITNHESAPTIFFLFFSKYNPVLFQEETRGSAMRDFDRIAFGEYEFLQEDCPLREIQPKNGLETIRTSTGESGNLYVNYATCEVPTNNSRLIDEVRRGDGTLIFQILEYVK